MVALRDVRRFSLLICAALTSASLLPAIAQTPAPVPAAVEQAAHSSITRGTLEAPIRFLSSDYLEGRGPGTRGDQLARLYLATQLESLGLQPGGPNGQWQQPVDMVGIKAQFPKTWSFQGKSERVDLAWREAGAGKRGRAGLRPGGRREVRHLVHRDLPERLPEPQRIHGFHPAQRLCSPA